MITCPLIVGFEQLIMTVELMIVCCYYINCLLTSCMNSHNTIMIGGWLRLLGNTGAPSSTDTDTDWTLTSDTDTDTDWTLTSDI